MVKFGFRWLLFFGFIVLSLNTLFVVYYMHLNIARACTPEERQVIQHYISAPKSDTLKPKAAIHYLIQSDHASIQTLSKSLQSLDRYFNDKFHYPVILFHEEHLTDAVKRVLKYSSNSDLIFQNVTFSVPESIQNDVVTNLFGKTIGYRHMCRFQAIGIYDQPIMRRLDYAWRLDDDSFIRSDIPYDIFRYMSDNDLTYGYIQKNYESRRRSRHLWTFVQNYIQENKIATQFFHEWPIRQQYYNNFEVSATKLWRSKEYQDYVHAIDRSEGIYLRMWGDATIKSIGVSMFVPVNKTHYFCDIGYDHTTLLKDPW